MRPSGIDQTPRTPPVGSDLNSPSVTPQISKKLEFSPEREETLRESIFSGYPNSPVGQEQQQKILPIKEKEWGFSIKQTFSLTFDRSASENNYLSFGLRSPLGLSPSDDSFTLPQTPPLSPSGSPRGFISDDFLAEQGLVLESLSEKIWDVIGKLSLFDESFSELLEIYDKLTDGVIREENESLKEVNDHLRCEINDKATELLSIEETDVESKIKAYVYLANFLREDYLHCINIKIADMREILSLTKFRGDLETLKNQFDREYTSIQNFYDRTLSTFSEIPSYYAIENCKSSYPSSMVSSTSSSSSSSVETLIPSITTPLSFLKEHWISTDETAAQALKRVLHTSLISFKKSDDPKFARFVDQLDELLPIIETLIDQVCLPNRLPKETTEGACHLIELISNKMILKIENDLEIFGINKKRDVQILAALKLLNETFSQNSSNFSKISDYSMTLITCGEVEQDFYALEGKDLSKSLQKQFLSYRDCIKLAKHHYLNLNKFWEAFSQAGNYSIDFDSILAYFDRLEAGLDMDAEFEKINSVRKSLIDEIIYLSSLSLFDYSLQKPEELNHFCRYPTEKSIEKFNLKFFFHPFETMSEEDKNFRINSLYINFFEKNLMSSMHQSLDVINKIISLYFGKISESRSTKCDDFKAKISDQILCFAHLIQKIKSFSRIDPKVHQAIDDFLLSTAEFSDEEKLGDKMMALVTYEMSEELRDTRHFFNYGNRLMNAFIFPLFRVITLIEKSDKEMDQEKESLLKEVRVHAESLLTIIKRFPLDVDDSRLVCSE